MSESLTDWDSGTLYWKEQQELFVYHWHTRGPIGEGWTIKTRTAWTGVRFISEICIEIQKMFWTFDGWMEFAVKWDQTVMEENLKSLRKSLRKTNIGQRGDEDASQWPMICEQDLKLVRHSSKILSDLYYTPFLYKILSSKTPIMCQYPNVNGCMDLVCLSVTC